MVEEKALRLQQDVIAFQTECEKERAVARPIARWKWLRPSLLCWLPKQLSKKRWES